MPTAASTATAIARRRVRDHPPLSREEVSFEPAEMGWDVCLAFILRWGADAGLHPRWSDGVHRSNARGSAPPENESGLGYTITRVMLAGLMRPMPHDE